MDLTIFNIDFIESCKSEENLLIIFNKVDTYL